MKKKLFKLSAMALLGIAGLSANAQTSWSITGNSNTGQSNFIGTKNANPLIIRTNNIERMRVTKNGQIGIGITLPIYNLQIQNPTFYEGIHVDNNFNFSEDRIGVYSRSVTGPGWGYGISTEGGYYGIWATGEGGNYSLDVTGVRGEATGSAGSRYGIYGTASGGSFNAAGYFDGNVWANNYFNISDRKFKAGITQLKSSTSLDQLLKLKPSAYEFKTVDYPKMGLPEGKQMGLIADEVKQVFPELVKEAVHPGEYSRDKKEVLHPEVRFEGVNYIGLIPVLIASIQEQQKTIDAVKAENVAIKAENQELKSRLDKIEQMLAVKSSSTVTSSAARLEQNAPNPFNQNTVINYYLPEDVRNAKIAITDANGRMVKAVPLTTKGNGQFILEGGQLAAGTYQYSLIVNEKAVDTKKMVLLR